jgi:hypothetical protein
VRTPRGRLSHRLRPGGGGVLNPPA